MKGDADLEIVCPRCGATGDEDVERLRRDRVVCRNCGIVKCSQPSLGKQRKKRRKKVDPPKDIERRARVLLACLESPDPAISATARQRLVLLLDGEEPTTTTLADVLKTSIRNARRIAAALRRVAA